jgi:hypothetical protein
MYDFEQGHLYKALSEKYDTGVNGERMAVCQYPDFSCEGRLQVYRLNGRVKCLQVQAEKPKTE